MECPESDRMVDTEAKLISLTCMAWRTSVECDVCVSLLCFLFQLVASVIPHRLIIAKSLERHETHYHHTGQSV